MSASTVSMHEWFSNFRDSVSPQIEQIHPSAARACRGYLAEMEDAIARGDNGPSSIACCALCRTRLLMSLNAKKTRNALLMNPVMSHGACDD
jgi:hypothetical protein